MMRWTWVLLGVALCCPVVLRAQRDSVTRRHDGTLPVAPAALGQRATVQHAVVHWGKWLAAGAAAAFTIMGAHEHENSNREWDRLLDLCRANNDDCVLGPSGAYLNPTAEQLYQRSLHFDGRARTRLLAGQGALLLAAGLFIADLRTHPGGPQNKPLGPLEISGDRRTGGVQVGVRLNF